MYKQSPSRSHRSKGIKVKHILQVCLLLAVCLWLIYQVKHSHEKRKEFDTKDQKVVRKDEVDGEIQRLGRKDLPRPTQLVTDVKKHGEDEEEKDAEEEEEEEITHEEDELEKEDNKHEEEVDGGRGGEDDEMDESETERTDAEAEREDESVDEDKEKEENHIENEENEDIFKEEDHSENEENEDAGKEEHTELEESEDVKREGHHESNAASEDQNQDGMNTYTHEAREEQYKADDASSEVAHEIQRIIPETGNLTTGQAGEIWGKVSFGQGNETQTLDKEAALIKSRVQRREDMHLSVTSATETVTEQKYETDSNKSAENSALPRHPNDQPENRSNSSDTSGEQALLMSNAKRPSSLSQNGTFEGAMHGEEHSSKSLLAEESSITTQNVKTKAGETLNPGNSTLDPSHETKQTDAMEAAGESSLKTGKKPSSGTKSVSDEISESHASAESAGSIQYDPVNTSHSSIALEGRESKTNPGSLPAIRSEVQSIDAIVAE